MHGRARMVVEFVPLPSVPITTKVMSSNLAHGGVYSIQYYVLKFVSDLRKEPVSSTEKNWPPRYNLNIIESGVKHHNPNPSNIFIGFLGSEN